MSVPEIRVKIPVDNSKQLVASLQCGTVYQISDDSPLAWVVLPDFKSLCLNDMEICSRDENQYAVKVFSKILIEVS